MAGPHWPDPYGPEHCGENTLFLYDEPDVHFNDEWSRDFVRFVYAMCSMDGKSGNEFLIATHSDLILTDAMWEQIHLFENPTGSKTEVKDLEISYFCSRTGQYFQTGI